MSTEKAKQIARELFTPGKAGDSFPRYFAQINFAGDTACVRIPYQEVVGKNRELMIALAKIVNESSDGKGVDYLRLSADLLRAIGGEVECKHYKIKREMVKHSNNECFVTEFCLVLQFGPD